MVDWQTAKSMLFHRVKIKDVNGNIKQGKMTCLESIWDSDTGHDEMWIEGEEYTIPLDDIMEIEDIED